ncbi:MAG TPA: cobaltochelatase subunit CobT, partial [Stellaceae bacterium]|nr:cobaltochelatase subunit CobT [Stellaceae bacterium]
MAESSSPVEVFKRSTTAALRAIAERDDVTVTYGPEPPGLAGPRARLPMPPRDLSQHEASLVRGAADALALRLRYHDAQLHARRLPQNEVARAIFEGVEQARVEALGARRMSGLAANLAAMLDQRYRRQGYDRLTERSDSTLAEAIRLLTREQLTGAPPPPAAQRLVDLWRPFLEGRIGRDIRDLDRLVDDQDSYGKAARKLIKDLDLDLGEADAS